MNTITIVGAGPIGLMTAIRLRELGWRAIVLEEDKSIGLPENCTGLISRTGIKELGLDLKKCLVNSIKSAELIAPNGTTISIQKRSDVAFVIDRKEFDKSLYEKALGLGAKVELNTKLIDIRQNTLFIKKRQRGEIKKSRIIVGADGVNSIVRKLALGQIQEKFFVHTYQERAQGSFDSKKVKMFFGSFAPGFFAWIVPENREIARIGIGNSLAINPRESFEKFKEKAGLEFETIERKSFLIPVGPPLKNIVQGNILLAGDAAFQTKATTGGGLILGMLSARHCAKAISDHLKENKPLERYQKMVSGITKELKMHWKIRSYLNGLNDEKLNKLFFKLKNAGIEEFLEEYGDMDKPSKFIGKIFRKPSMWKLAGLALRFR